MTRSSIRPFIEISARSALRCVQPIWPQTFDLKRSGGIIRIKKTKTNNFRIIQEKIRINEESRENAVFNHLILLVKDSSRLDGAPG